MATRRTNRTYQYEPLVTPSNWTGDAQRYAIRLSQILDDLYNKVGNAKKVENTVVVGDPELGMYAFHIDDNGHLICEYDTDSPPPLSIDSRGHLMWTVDSGNTVDLGKVTGEGAGGVSFDVDDTLKFENGVLSVNRATEVEADNTLPITSAAVYTTVGNIDALLSTI